MRALKGWARLNDLLGRLEDLPAGRITVGDLLTIIEAKAANSAYPPIWEEETDKWSDRLQIVLDRAREQETPA